MFTATSIAICITLSLFATAAGAAGIKTAADANGPAQIEYLPPSGPGRVVIVVAGKMGPAYYESYAESVAQLGYDTIVLNGDDILSPDKQGGTRLQQAITRAQASPHAFPGKLAVIGLSEGGGGALAYATRRPSSVAVVIVYYPETAFLLRPGEDLKAFVAAFKVPVLAFAGAKDTYNNCCLITTIKTIEADAKLLGLPFELVVYPDAEHDFIKGAHYRAGDADDAWKRTTDELRQYLSETSAH